jgi:diguanylate cyclase
VISTSPARPGRTSVAWLTRLVVAGATVGVVLWSVDGSYVVRAATALVAGTVLVRAAARHRDSLTRARGLFAASLFVGAASGLASAAYQLVTGEPAATGWLSDWVYLCYGPLAVLAVLAVPTSAGRLGRVDATVRMLADGAVAAGALWYIAMALLIEPRQLGASLEPGARFITLAYPLLPAFVVAVMLSALPRVTRGARPFLFRAVAGVGLLGGADAAFAVASWGGWYDPASWIAALSQLGLLLMLDAALVAAHPAAAPPPQASDAAMAATHGGLLMAAQYVPAFGAIAVMLGEMLAGRGVRPSEVAPVLLIGTAVIVRQIANIRETGLLVALLSARERAASTQARTDALTGLSNRTHFCDQLAGALCDPSAHPVAVALLDLNDFKDINDTHGHDTGDQVLIKTAERLRRAVPDGGVARLGGDEFAVFVPASTDGGQGLAALIKAAFAEPVVVGQRRFQVRPSVGVVLDERPPGAGRPDDVAHLLSHADIAMYEAKAAKSLHAVPIVVLTGRARATATASIGIRDEISTPDLSQFRVEYQPVVDLQTGVIVGGEALLRWHHPDFGEISPVTFIPLAEGVGSIGALGDFVMDVALADLASWEGLPGPLRFVGVNVSPRELTQPAWAQTVAARLKGHRLLPEQLVLEVTEEAFVDDLETVVETIAALRAAGVSVAVDDFGTGHSSLRYLRRFDVNIVKIDREFVQASSTEPRTDALVRSVIAMAIALDLSCVAEGIETLEQLKLVRGHGCKLGQGFLLSRSMPAEALAALLARGHVYPVDVQAPEGGATAPVVRLRGVH